VSDGRLKRFFRLLIVEVVIAALTFAAVRADDEAYVVRPDILQVTPQSKEFSPIWTALKAAHFSFVAELLAFYPQDAHFYFLARDSEYIYDVARLVTAGRPEWASRFHLINVSRANMRDENLKTEMRRP
jgi:hypothetical protein